MNHRDTEAQRPHREERERERERERELEVATGVNLDRDPLTEQIIGAAIEVHRLLGPGLLESAYEVCLAYDLIEMGLAIDRQRALPLIYKTIKLEQVYRLDLVVEGEVVVEIKTVERLLPIHQAQLLTYLKLGGYKRGLLLNFHSAVLRDGIRRVMA